MKWSRIEEEREIEELEREGMGLKHAWRGVGDERLMTIKKRGVIIIINIRAGKGE